MDSTLVQRAKDTDLLTLAGRHTTLKRAASSGGGEWAGPCPICGGRDRFHVQPQEARWLCRHCTEGKWQDAIALQMRLANQTFPQAVEVLAGNAVLPSRPARPLPAEGQAEHSGPPSGEWQAQARACMADAQTVLWSAAGAKALAWLHARGLTDETILAAQLGYIPSPRYEPAAAWGLTGKDVYLPRGILIPCEVAGVVWYVKVRRSDHDLKEAKARGVDLSKYPQVRGVRPALYWAQSLAGQDVAIFCEGEFDTLLLWQEVGDLAGVVTLGSASNRLAVGTWGLYLLAVRRRLLAYDLDEAGDRGAAALGWLGNVQRLPVPQLRPGDKDLTDFQRAGGDLRAWLEGCIGSVEGCEIAKRGPSEAFSGDPGHKCPGSGKKGAQSPPGESAWRWDAWQAAPGDRALELAFIASAIRDGWPFYDDTGAELGAAGWLEWGRVGKEVQWQNSPS